MTSELVTVWQPQPGFQTAFVNCPVFEVFGGGARGGGKTDAVLGDWALHAGEYGPSAIGLMVRRTRTELDETFERARALYAQIGAHVTYSPRRITMPNGARITYAYLERDSDAETYQGASYTRVYVEEVGNFPSPTPVMKLMATLRSGDGVPVGIRLTGNPGGPGHQWCKARWIDPAPQGWKIITDETTGLQRLYIPSRVTDNRYLNEDYVQRLKASGSPELVRAWLYGDWSVVAGSFFPEFSLDRHVIAPRTLPDHWPRFRSFDWGSARPFACHWWAVSDGSVSGIARGCLVNYREWYGMKPNEPNVGLRMTAEAIAAGIKSREDGDPKPMTGVADPAMFAEDGGPSIAHRMMGGGVIFRPADNKRVAGRGAMGGWDQVRARLDGDADGKPMLLLFSTSRDLIRTLPALQHDDARPEDVDSDMEDHAPDSCFVGSTRITTQRGTVRIDRIRVGDMALTRDGYRPVSAVFTNGEQPVMGVRLSDGSVLTGTANHPIWVEGDGFVSLSYLRYGDMMRPSWSLSLVPRSSNSWASAITAAVATFSTRVSGSIVSFGRTLMGKSHEARIFITETSMWRTINQTIWSASPKMSICRTTGSYVQATQRLISRSTLAHPRPRGTPRQQAVNGIVSILSGIVQLSTDVSQWCARLVEPNSMASQTTAVSAPMPANRLIDGEFKPMWWSGLARAVGALSGPISISNRSIARWHASNLMNGPSLLRRAITAVLLSWRKTRAPSGALTVVGAPTIGGRQRVYNLSVEQAEEYFANGVLVHNCRYACMSRPFVRELAPAQPTDSWDRAFSRASQSTVESWRVA